MALPIETWTSSIDYEPMHVVEYQGVYYTARRYVNAGVDINNRLYWASNSTNSSNIDEETLQTLMDNDTKHDNSISTINTNITNLNSRITSIITDMDLIESAISSISSSLGTLTSRFEELVQSNDSDIGRLTSHEQGDLTRWQQISDSELELYQSIMIEVKKLYAGTIPNYDYDHPTVILGQGGLLSLGGSETYVCPTNGGLKWVYTTILSAGVSLEVNGTSVFSVDVGLLGSHSNDEPYKVNAGDVITSNGLLGLGDSLTVTFYPTEL